MHNMDDEDMAVPAHVALGTASISTFDASLRIWSTHLRDHGSSDHSRPVSTSEARLLAAQVASRLNASFLKRANKGVVVAISISEGWKWPDWERFVFGSKPPWSKRAPRPA